MSARKRRASTPAKSKGRHRKQPNKPVTGDERVIQESRRLDALLVKHYATMKKRKPRLLLPERVTLFRATLRETTTAATGHMVGKNLARAAVARKDKLLAELAEEVIGIRDEIAAACDDPDTKRAFGVGSAADPRNAKQILALASLQQQSWESDEFGPAARAIGIDKKRINRLIVKRREAAAARADQGEVFTSKVGLRAEKRRLVRELSKMNTQIRRVGRIVFSKDAKILPSFAEQTSKRPAHRKKKKAAAPTPTPAAAAE